MRCPWLRKPSCLIASRRVGIRSFISGCLLSWSQMRFGNLRPVCCTNLRRTSPIVALQQSSEKHLKPLTFFLSSGGARVTRAIMVRKLRAERC